MNEYALWSTEMKNRICALTVTLMLSTLPVVAGESAGEGIRAYRAGDYAKAEQLYRKALTEETDNGQLAAIYRNMAILYAAQGKDGAEFTKKADELNPPDTPSYIHSNATSDTSKNVNRQSFINKNELNREIGTPADPNQSKQALNGKQDPAASNGLAPTPSMMTGFSTSQTYESTSLGGGFRLGPRGSGLNINGGYRSDSGYNTFPGGFGYPSNQFYSVQTPTSNFQYSDNTPMVLPAANGPPVIINAPGPNIYSQQQAPDGSTTTIIKRTE